VCGAQESGWTCGLTASLLATRGSMGLASSAALRPCRDTRWRSSKEAESFRDQECDMCMCIASRYPRAPIQERCASRASIARMTSSLPPTAAVGSSNCA
jgi:hypothetical protein